MRCVLVIVLLSAAVGLASPVPGYSQDGSQPKQDPPKLKTVIVAPFVVAKEANVTKDQLAQALVAPSRVRKHFQRLPPPQLLKSLSDVRDLADVDWGDAKPEYVVLSPEVLRVGGSLSLGATLVSVAKGEVAVVEAFGRDATELMRNFWKELDQPLEEIGAPRVSGVWQLPSRKLLLVQSGARVYGRVTESDKRLRGPTDWGACRGRLVHRDGGWGLSFDLWKLDDRDALVANGTLAVSELAVDDGVITVAGGEIWRRLSDQKLAEAGKAATELWTKARELRSAVRAAVEKPEDETLADGLSFRVFGVQRRAAEILVAESDLLPGADRFRLVEELALLERELADRPPAAKPISGADANAGIPILGDWGMADFEKFQWGQGAVVRVSARLKRDPKNRANDQVIFQCGERLSPSTPMVMKEYSAGVGAGLYYNDITIRLAAERGAGTVRFGLSIGPQAFETPQSDTSLPKRRIVGIGVKQDLFTGSDEERKQIALDPKKIVKGPENVLMPLWP